MQITSPFLSYQHSDFRELHINDQIPSVFLNSWWSSWEFFLVENFLEWAGSSGAAFLEQSSRWHYWQVLAWSNNWILWHVSSLNIGSSLYSPWGLFNFLHVPLSFPVYFCSRKLTCVLLCSFIKVPVIFQAFPLPFASIISCFSDKRFQAERWYFFLSFYAVYYSVSARPFRS